MTTNSAVIQDAILCNEINNKSLIISNSQKGLSINREIILSNYTKESIDDCWESLSTNIIQNYQRGKGTYIKGFGTFTFKRRITNLEGTTNEYFRDKREDEPVFIASKELNEDCMPGEYTKMNTIKYYIQKESKDIPIIKLNYSDIAYRLSMSKDEVENILTHLFKNIGESISSGEFKNKTMPNLGVLFCKHKILAMKFNDDFISKTKDKNPKLTKTKKNIFMDMDVNPNNSFAGNKFLSSTLQSLEELKATNALNTNVERSGYNYLNSIYNIDIKKYPKHELKEIYNSYNQNSGYINFINDYKARNVSLDIKEKERNNLMKSPLFLLDKEIIKSFQYFKGILILNCKKFDDNKRGIITKEEAINSIIYSKISSKIDYNMAKSIVDFYNKTPNVEYMKFIAQIIKDVQNYLNNGKNDKNDENNSTIKSVNLNLSTARGNTFYKINNNSFNKTKKIRNRMNRSCLNNFCSNKSSSPNGRQNYKILSKVKEREKKTNEINNNNVSVREEIKNDENDINKSIEMNDINNNNDNNCSTNANLNVFDKYKNIDELKAMIKNIKILIPELKIKYSTSLTQNISSYEFINILKKYDISYLKSDIDSLLIFLGIKDINSFSLKDFFSLVKLCKVVETSMKLSNLNEIMRNLKDIIYINGGINFLFNNKNSLNRDNFIKLLLDKTEYDYNTLKNVFYYLVKSDREFTVDDYFLYFDNDKKVLSEQYYLNLMKEIINEINNKHLNPDEYFNHLLSYNYSMKDKYITRLNWIKYLLKEKVNFPIKDLDNLFLWIDTKKDNLLDIDEFVSKCNYTTKPLTVFKDIIYCNKLDIEDLAHRMNIDINELENYDYNTFSTKIKKVDYTLSDEFIQSIFEELSKKDNNGKNTIESKQFLKEIDYKKNDYYLNNKYFTQKYKESIKNKIDYENLKKIFEKKDNESLGFLPKIDYVMAISSVIPEFNDDDHMKFVRISDGLDNFDNVIYPKILNVIYFYTEEKLNDSFTQLCQTLSQILVNKCDNDIEKLMFLIDIGVPKKSKTLTVHKPLLVNQISKFLVQNYNKNIPEKIILKLDIDSDGLISYEDLKSVLKRYTLTSYFKYDNDSGNPNVNLFSKETISEEKLKNIIKKLQHYMKTKNITETGLFKKLDKNEDGFISNVDFNEEINDIIQLSSSIKDQFFNYLDFYHIGMVDLATFISRLNNMNNNAELNFLVQNNNLIENEILKKFKDFILKNNKLSDNEIFEVLDKDCDGVINYGDFQNFVVNNLNISKEDFTKEKLERVMMSLSLSKNLQIGINDIREFIDLCNENKEYMNLKETFKITSNQNLSELKKNKDWTNDIIERLGMYLSEKYDSIEQFFEENTTPGSGKFKFEDFLKFQENNYDLFNNGFNLTKDEILSIYTSLDSQKKNYLTLTDLKNKLQIFNFYTKMHIDIKNFMQQNFMNGIDAFKFFMKPKNNINDSEIKKENENENETKAKEENKNNKKYFITLKEIFNTFENFFPKKYASNTILKYLNKYFNITIPKNNDNLKEKKDIITYEEFNYIYFEKFEKNKNFLDKKGFNTKLITNRIKIIDSLKNPKKKIIQRSSSTFYYSNLFKKKFKNLTTPFDEDPLNKIKRIIFSSKYNLNKFFETATLECDNNNLLVNKHQFKNIIRALNIGLTNLEIDYIISKCGKMSYDGKINLREFIKFLREQNSLLEEGKKNISHIIGEIKSLIYKYYGNPIICFQNNDSDHLGKIDFEKFKNIIFDMYQRNNQELPTFILIKNAYDTLDLRKDGIIDIKEWCISFASYNGKLDVNSEKVPNGPEFFSNQIQSIKDNNIKNKIHNRINLREWETSSDITDLYLLIYKNRKLIKEKIFQSNCTLNGSGDTLVQADNLLNIIRDLLPNNKLSQTQWKMIVSIAQNESNNNLIDIDKFFRLMEITSKHLMSHPKIKVSKSVGDFSGLINDKSKKSIEVNHLKMRKYNNVNNINKQKVNSVNLVNFGNVILPNELKGKKLK